MGDRANVCVKNRRETVYLYTHWAGTDLPETVRQALSSTAGRNRWTDASYLTRIIFSRMIRNDIDGETGYGIWPTVGDGEDRVLIVDVPSQHVFINGSEYSFGDFCALDEADWNGREGYGDDNE